MSTPIPTGQGATPEQVDQIARLLNLAALTLEHYRAERDVQRAKADYYARLREFDLNFACGERVNPGTSDWAANYSSEAFEAYKDARAKAYNVKRRLDNACKAVS